jgi:hypothetical protein
MKKKYFYNEDFFNIIDTEEKAYFLGVIYADGSIGKTKSKICKNVQHKVSLAMIDKEPLELFRDSLNGDFPIKERTLPNGKVFYSLVLTSKKMVNDLEDKGCVENKSLILRFPKLSRELLPDFVRGYFDGDGSIFASTQKVTRNKATFSYTRPVIHICGTKELLEKLISILRLPQTCLKKEKRRVTNCWYIRFDSFVRVEKFYNFIYTNKKYFLTRKKDKFDLIFKQRGSETIMGTPTRGKYKSTRGRWYSPISHESVS